MKTLVTGGVRSGKSVHAERLAAEAARVTYVAPGRRPDPGMDPDWAARVAEHQQRRPDAWATVESCDTSEIAALLASLVDAGELVLLDCLGTWLTGVLDAIGWDEPDATERALSQVDALAQAVATSRGSIVIVTNEVGWGVVPEHRSGRIFRDLLGSANQRIAAVSDDVLLVVAGRALRL